MCMYLMVDTPEIGLETQTRVYIGIQNPCLIAKSRD